MLTIVSVQESSKSARVQIVTRTAPNFGSGESGAKLWHATYAQTCPNSTIPSRTYKSVKSSIHSQTGCYPQDIIAVIVTPNMTQLETPNHETTKSSTHDVIPNAKNESIVVSSSLVTLLVTMLIDGYRLACEMA